MMRSNKSILGRLFGSLATAGLLGYGAYTLWPTGLISESAASDTTMAVVRAVLSIAAGVGCVAALLSMGSAAD